MMKRKLKIKARQRVQSYANTRRKIVFFREKNITAEQLPQ
jgi:hypothetical protein